MYPKSNFILAFKNEFCTFKGRGGTPVRPVTGVGEGVVGSRRGGGIQSDV